MLNTDSGQSLVSWTCTSQDPKGDHQYREKDYSGGCESAESDDWIMILIQCMQIACCHIHASCIMSFICMKSVYFEPRIHWVRC